MRREWVQGDTAPALYFEALEYGDPEDLSDATAYALRVELPDGTREVWTASPLDLTTGKFAHYWNASETEQVGHPRAQLVVTRGDGRTQTFPSDTTYIRWRINPRLT